MGELQIARGVLDQDLAAEEILCLLHMRADHAERFLGVGQGEEIVEVDAAGDAPRNMFGDEIGLQPRDQRLDARQMGAVERAVGPEREADAMQAQRVVGAGSLEKGQRPPAAEIVLAVNFEPADRRPALEDGAVVLMPQPEFQRGPESGRHEAKQVLALRSAGSNSGPPPQAFGSRLPPLILSQVPLGT